MAPGDHLADMSERNSKKDAEHAFADMGMEAHQRLAGNKKSLFRSIANNPKIIFIAFFAS